jgi:hypothetical protein
LRSPNPFLLSSMEPLTWVLLSTFVPPTLSTFAHDCERRGKAPLRVQRYLPGIYSYSASDLQSEHRGGCVLGSTNGCRVGPPRNVGGRQANNVTGKRATQVSERRTSTYYLDFNTLLLNTTKTHRGPQY